MGLKIHDKFKSTLKANVILIKNKAGELILYSKNNKSTLITSIMIDIQINTIELRIQKDTHTFLVT